MSHALLRATFLLTVALLVFEPVASFGRGPGGGAPAAGGHGGNRGELASPAKKKKQGSTRSGAKRGASWKKPGLDGLHASSKVGSQGLNGGLERLPGSQDRLQNNMATDKLRPRQEPVGQKWQSRDGQFPQTAKNGFQDFKNGPQPFTAPWYAEHPNAWQATHPHADAWAAASAAGVAAWLGWADYADTGSGVTYYDNSVVYEQPPADESEDYANESTTETDTTDADTSADDSQWLQLGVYAVTSISGEPTSRHLQLAVNRQGELAGVYYDTITGQSQNIVGAIDQSTQIAQWQLESNSGVTFRAALDDLTQPDGTIQVVQGTNTQEWRIARQESSR